MGVKEEKRPLLDEGLLTAMRALDNQIARAMERTPAERERSGVQKWEPYAERVERVCVFLMDSLGEQTIQVDSLLILSQAFAKVLNLVVEDLGREGLGALRSSYFIAAAESIVRDAERAKGGLNGATNLT